MNSKVERRGPFESYGVFGKWAISLNSQHANDCDMHNSTWWQFITRESETCRLTLMENSNMDEW
jgi:hypothetical protein